MNVRTDRRKNAREIFTYISVAKRARPARKLGALSIVEIGQFSQHRLVRLGGQCGERALEKDEKIGLAAKRHKLFPRHGHFKHAIEQTRVDGHTKHVASA